MDGQSPTALALRSLAEVATPKAERYLQQLCKHFGHKLPAAFDPHAGEVAFPIGACHLAAADGMLRLSLAAPDEARLAQLQDSLARHLVRFAFREALRIEWRPA